MTACFQTTKGADRQGPLAVNALLAGEPGGRAARVKPLDSRLSAAMMVKASWRVEKIDLAVVQPGLIECRMNGFLGGLQPQRIATLLQAERVGGTGATDDVDSLLFALGVALIAENDRRGAVADGAGVVRVQSGRRSFGT